MPDTEPHRRETSDNQRPDGRGRVPRNFDSAFPARNYLSPLLPPGGAEGIRLAESSVNPAGLRLKRHMDKLAPRFRRRSPARSSFRFSARRSDCTLWLCRRLCGVELCGARQDSGPPRAEAAARAVPWRRRVPTGCETCTDRKSEQYKTKYARMQPSCRTEGRRTATQKLKTRNTAGYFCGQT